MTPGDLELTVLDAEQLINARLDMDGPAMNAGFQRLRETNPLPIILALATLAGCAIQVIEHNSDLTTRQIVAHCRESAMQSMCTPAELDEK